MCIFLADIFYGSIIADFFLTDQSAQINTGLNFVLHNEFIETENKSSKTACGIIRLAFARKLEEGRGMGGPGFFDCLGARHSSTGP